MDTGPVIRAMRQAVADQVVPGMVLAAATRSDGPHLLVAGSASLIPEPQPMQVDTVFDLASLTKVLATTTVTMRLVEQGLLRLDAPLREAAPGLYRGRTGELTVRHLLTHTAGFPPFIRYYRHESPRAMDGTARRRRVLEAIRTAQLVYPPGSESQYSDLGMVVLGDIIEQVCGSRLDHVFAREVARPLGLRDTFFRHLETPLPEARRPTEVFAATEQCPWRRELVRGWVHDENAYLLLGVAGHAGLFATAGDVMSLATALLAGYHGRTDYLRAETVREFVRRQHLVDESDRALGWGTPSPGASCGSRFAANAFGHTGFTGTSVWIDPEAERVVVVLANRVHPSRENTAFLTFRPGFHDLVIEALG